MQLISLTTSKEINPNYKVSTKRRHGIFECPVCHSHVERSLTEGTNNKTCGNKECRKAAGNFKGAAGRFKDNAITGHPLYTNIMYHWTKLSKNPHIALPVKWHDSNTFIKDNIAILEKATALFKGVKLTCKFTLPDTIEFVPKVVTATKLKKYKAGKSKAFLYLIRSLDKVKIGIALNVNARLKDLSTGNPHGLEILYSIEVTGARQLEAYLHHTYDSYRVAGEWFTLNDEQLEDIVEYVEGSITNNKWQGATAVVHTSQTVRTYTQKDLNDKPKVSKATTKSHITTVTTNVIPKAIRAPGKTKHPMYNAWRTIMNRKAKGFTTESSWDDFEVFVEDMQDSFNKCSSPTLYTISGEYTRASCTFINRKAFSSNAVQVIATPLNSKENKGYGASTIYSSAKEAAISTGSTSAHITACCKGKRNSHNGYKWEYVK